MIFIRESGRAKDCSVPFFSGFILPLTGPLSRHRGNKSVGYDSYAKAIAMADHKAGSGS